MTHQCRFFYFDINSHVCILYLCNNKTNCQINFDKNANFIEFTTSHNVNITNQTNLSEYSTLMPIDKLNSNNSYFVKENKNLLQLTTPVVKDKSELTLNPYKIKNINSKYISNDCQLDYIFENGAIPNSTIAILVTQKPSENVYTIEECGNLCCNQQNCDVGYLQGTTCFFLSCTNLKLCYFTTGESLIGQNDVKQSLVYLKRNGISIFEKLVPSIKKHKDSLQNTKSNKIVFQSKSLDGSCYFSSPIQALFQVWKISQSFYKIILSENLEKCQEICCQHKNCFIAYQHEGYCFAIECKYKQKHKCFKYTHEPYLKNSNMINSQVVFVKHKLYKPQIQVSNIDSVKLFNYSEQIKETTTTPSIFVYDYNKPNIPIPFIYKETYNNYNPPFIQLTPPPTPLFSQYKFEIPKIYQQPEYFQPYLDFNQFRNVYNFNKTNSITYFEEQPVIIKIVPQSLILTQHLSATFHCIVKNPEFTKIKWLKSLDKSLPFYSSSSSSSSYGDSLEPLVSNDRINILDHGYLIINDLHPYDSGYYVCKASSLNNNENTYQQASLSVNDIDECKLNIKSPCKHTCINTIGSYYCKCHKGYKLSKIDNSTCYDIDECQHKSLNSCNQICINEEGSYKCKCLSGYEMDKATQKCQDINECQVLKDPCGKALCKNKLGSYICYCNPEYDYYSPEKMQCIKNQSLFVNEQNLFKRMINSPNFISYVLNMIGYISIVILIIIIIIIICKKCACCKKSNNLENKNSESKTT